MVEGGGSDDFRLVKGMLYKRPDLMHTMLTVTADAVRDYLNAQIEAGAHRRQQHLAIGGAELADGRGHAVDKGGGRWPL
jgi:uroporphyrinogen decarboxylase